MPPLQTNPSAPPQLFPTGEGTNTLPNFTNRVYEMKLITTETSPKPISSFYEMNIKTPQAVQAALYLQWKFFDSLGAKITYLMSLADNTHLECKQTNDPQTCFYSSLIDLTVLKTLKLESAIMTQKLTNVPSGELFFYPNKTPELIDL